MKNSQAFEFRNNADDDLLPEYNFDYRKALPNRFASQQENQQFHRLKDRLCKCSQL